MKCTAHCRGTQKPCGKHAIRGRTTCRNHGGKTPIGPGSATFRSGARSKFLPSRLAAAYRALEHDPELIQHRRDLATVEARIIDVLKRVDTGEAGALWRALQTTAATFAREQAKGHEPGMRAAFEAQQRLIRAGAADAAAWREVITLIEQRRKLVDSEQRRLAQAHETLTADRAMMLITVLVDIITRHVTDRAILAKIAADLQARGLGSVHPCREPLNPEQAGHNGSRAGPVGRGTMPAMRQGARDEARLC